MTQIEIDGLKLRADAMELRAEAMERRSSLLELLLVVLAGLVVAFVVVGAVELYHVNQQMEAQQWRSR